jgi:hypothetical protein
MFLLYCATSFRASSLMSKKQKNYKEIKKTAGIEVFLAIFV